MSYFKILRWSGGEGGDALINSYLLSYDSIYSNCILSEKEIDHNGRLFLETNPGSPTNLKRSIQDVNSVRYHDLLEEIRNLREQHDFVMLKSHMMNMDLPNCINLLPSEKSLDFYVSARIRKIGLIESLRSYKDDLDFRKKGKSEIIKMHKERSRSYLDDLRKKCSSDLVIDDLISLNFSKIDRVLGLEIKDQGRALLRRWVDKQFEIYPEELSSFR